MVVLIKFKGETLHDVKIKVLDEEELEKEELVAWKWLGIEFDILRK